MKSKHDIRLLTERFFNGETTVGDACHFRRAGSHEGTVIGGHVFW